MNQDRIGTVLIVLVAAWYGWLIADLPPLSVEVPWRNQLFGVAVLALLLAVFPRHLQLTGTVLAFAVLGLSGNLILFEYEALGWKTIVPAIVLVVALWLQRERLDLKDVVGVASLVAFGVAVVQPAVVWFAVIVIVVVNQVIWALNRSGKPGVS